MGKIELRVRDLRTGNQRNLAFDSVEAARDWLVQRPPFVEAIGVASEIDRDLSLTLKGAMRPLDPDELRAQRERDASAEAAQEERARAARAADLVAAEAQRSAAREADPNRPMQIHWTYDDGMKVAERYDERVITEEARAAVLAWIAERDEWVIGRGQVVGEARVTVWPNAVPSGDDRVTQGTFVPVTAPSAASKPN